MKKFIAYKKSILISIGFLFLMEYSTAQDSVAIKTLLSQKEYAHAKEAVDKLAAGTETAENYFLKAIVYDSIAKKPEANNLLPDARWQAFTALQKAAVLKNEYVLRQGQELAGDLYSGFINEGLANFNTAVDRSSKAGFENALAIFKKAEKVNEFGYRLKWDSVPLNSLLLSFLTKSAINAENETDALIYSKKILDINSDSKPIVAGKEIAYQWLLYYYSSRKEGETFNKYLALAKAAYPGNVIFALAEMDGLRQQKDYAGLFKKYQQLITADPGNLQYKLAYCSDIFNSLWPTKAAGAPVSAAQLIDILKPLTGSKETAVKANLLLAKTYINLAQEILTGAGNANTKVRYKNYLAISNKYLQRIIAAKENTNKPEWKEAKRLLLTNSKALRLAKRIVYYLLIILFNIMLIIGLC